MDSPLAISGRSTRLLLLRAMLRRRLGITRLVSASGLEAMGVSDIRAMAGTVAAFLVVMVIRRETKCGAHEERRVAKARGRRQTGRMPRTLDYLPAGNRAERAFVVEVLTAGFDEERSTRWAKHLKNGQILRIILYCGPREAAFRAGRS